MTHDFLRQSFILLDTNILIDGIKSPDAYQKLFDVLEKNDCKALLDPNVRVEFLRGAKTAKELDIYKQFLRALFGSSDASLSATTDIYDLSLKIMRSAKVNENKQISLPDALIISDDGKRFVEEVS